MQVTLCHDSMYCIMLSVLCHVTVSIWCSSDMGGGAKKEATRGTSNLFCCKTSGQPVHWHLTQGLCPRISVSCIYLKLKVEYAECMAWLGMVGKVNWEEGFK